MLKKKKKRKKKRKERKKKEKAPSKWNSQFPWVGDHQLQLVPGRGA